MPTYKIRGIDVDFPFEAYDCQLVYMEKVIQSLQERCNALLESPTGTGKTLCLLCAALAWRKSLGGFSTGKSCWKAMETGSGHADVLLSQSRGEKIPTLVYTSRTHSQLRQVIQELKRTNYRPKMVVLGSREQLCIHDDVSKLQGKAQTNACNYVCRKRRGNRCSHYPRVAEFLKINPQLGDEPIDIEELVNIGRSCGPCPYYLSKELHKVVDIVFAPYNYLIDHHYRKSLSIEWKNSVLIFDEAHNLESLCSEAASFDLSSGLLTACISEAKNCIDLSVARREKSSDKSYDPDNFAILRALLLKLEKRIAEVPIDSKELGFTKPGPYVYEFLSDLNITDETSSKLVNIIEDAATLLEEDLTGDRGNEKTKGSICRLESMGDILQIIFKDGRKSHAIYYCFHVQETEANGADVFKGKASRTMSWWCFNPGISMETFSKMEAGSIILTSGTLSPMDSFAQELKLKFPIRLENPHVITQSQIWAGIVAAGPSGCTFNSSYRNRDSLEYKQDLGNAIVNFARIVPDGLLVFFSSYYVLDQCIGCWKNVDSANLMNSSTIWERICRYKQPVVEPRQSSLFLLSIEDYMAKLKDTSSAGAIFFAVCRGKVSEGLDFADHAGRAVVITGMPFATRTDPKVRLKREYLDQWAISEKNGIAALTGEEWYSQQASRAVNQAVGRVIRHRNDYGAIIFCDERFLQPHRQSQISLWIRPHIQCYTKFGDAVFSLTQFFRDGGTHGCTRMKLASRDAKNVEMMKSTTQDQIRMQKFFTFPSAQVDRDCSSLSSLLEHKRGDLPGKWKDVPPANWSSLTPSKPFLTLGTRCSGNLLCNEKNLLTNRKKMMRCQSHETIDLTTYSSVDKAPAELPSCTGKKQKVFEKHTDAIQQSSSSPEKLSGTGKPETLNLSLNFNSVKHERDLPCDGTKQDALVSQKSKADVLGQRDGGHMSSPVSSSDKEKRGSAFLIQVQEMLSAVEYKKFLDFMKALKTKALEIDQVLQSIGRLFSGPERLPLRKRFKDYIPAKYHILYEKYFETSDND